ncbi:MAG: AtpZ/AtpI family protein [Bryobacteraceae bacterium]
MRPDNQKSLIWLSKYLSLAFTLPASVLAGYILGAVADHVLHLPILRAVGILLGMAAGLFQIVRELSRDERRTKDGS